MTFLSFTSSGIYPTTFPYLSAGHVHPCIHNTFRTLNPHSPPRRPTHPTTRVFKRRTTLIGPTAFLQKQCTYISIYPLYQSYRSKCNQPTTYTTSPPGSLRPPIPLSHPFLLPFSQLARSSQTIPPCSHSAAPSLTHILPTHPYTNTHAPPHQPTRQEFTFGMFHTTKSPPSLFFPVFSRPLFTVRIQKLFVKLAQSFHNPLHLLFRREESCAEVPRAIDLTEP